MVLLFVRAPYYPPLRYMGLRSSPSIGRHPLSNTTGIRNRLPEAGDMEISARNQIKGRSKALPTGSIMAAVDVAVEASDVTAVIARGSIEKMGLREVMIGKG